MAFDGVVTRAIVTELKSKIESGRIGKIYQPYKNELLFQVRSSGKNYKLLLSSHPSYARVHLTEEVYENPSEPPMFCMLLRKHLEGSIIEDIEQIELERVIIFHLQTKNEIGDISYKKLIIEIMGKHSNMILVDKERKMILDSIKHITPALSRYRTVLPGSEYIEPPSQEKVNPLSVDEESFLKKIDFNTGKIDKQIVSKFMGISPLLAKEVLYLAGLPNRKTVSSAFLKLTDEIRNMNFKPSIYVQNKKEIFYVMSLAQMGDVEKNFDSVSRMLDEFYYGKAERDRVKQQANDLERLLINERNKNEKKIKKLEKQLDDAKKAEKLQLYGELLTANLHLVKRGDKSIEVQNYYDEHGGTVVISLNPQKSPSENAQSYYQKYTKLKNSVHIVKEQIEKAKEEINYLETVLSQLETASPKDVEEIREELQQEGYIKKRVNHGKKKHANKKPVLEKYKSTDGTEILVGKNNIQNEYLTNKLARKNEVWLHTKDIPGSHVVIRSENPNEDTIVEAATIAAYFSKARESSQVPVDFTLIKHVKKPSGSKPGYVIYDNQSTVYVTPSKELVMRLRG